MTATQAPTPGPLDSESVKLLVKGDLLRHEKYGLAHFYDECGGRGEGWIIVECYDGKDAACRPENLTFIGRPADGWMPWSGGENPVDYRQNVEVRYRDGRIVQCAAGTQDWTRLSENGEDATDIIAFRLAPTAPVEASGSEREHGPKCWGKTSLSDEMAHCYCGSTDLRPQPSGETRGLEPLADDPAVAALCDSSYRAGALAGWNAANYSDPEEGERIMARIREVESGSLAPIAERNRQRSARPLALGGQHSTATDFPPDDVLACMDDTTPARAEAQDEGAAGEQTDNAFKIASDLHAAYEQLIYGLPKYLEAENLTDEENMIREAYITLDVTAHRLAAVSDAHPSPTPAADADRVRIAVEALERYAEQGYVGAQAALDKIGAPK